MPSTHCEGAAIYADRLRESFENHVFSPRSGMQFNSTVSIGITSYLAGDDAKKVLERVDKALYLAKQKGRNRVVTLFESR